MIITEAMKTAGWKKDASGTWRAPIAVREVLEEGGSNAGMLRKAQQTEGLLVEAFKAMGLSAAEARLAADGLKR